MPNDINKKEASDKKENIANEERRSTQTSPSTRISQGKAAEPLQKPRVLSNHDNARNDSANDDEFTRQTSEQSEIKGKEQNQGFEPKSGVTFNRDKKR